MLISEVLKEDLDPKGPEVTIGCLLYTSDAADE